MIKARERLRPFRIGELARRAGRSIHTIRWYETQGLLPGVVRDDGGRRMYTERHVSWLALVERLRRTGMSIAQMREYTSLVRQGSGSITAQRDVLQAHRARVEAMIEEWKDALDLLDRKLDFYGEWIATGNRPREKPATRVTRTTEDPTRSTRRPQRSC